MNPFYHELPVSKFDSHKQVSEPTDPDLPERLASQGERFEHGKKLFLKAKSDKRRREIVRSFNESEWPLFCDYIEVDWRTFR